jgi:hypothetical protein
MLYEIYIVRVLLAAPGAGMASYAAHLELAALPFRMRACACKQDITWDFTQDFTYRYTKDGARQR